jgi:predicted nuclease of predicted toxin-antitoxin system
MKLLFDQNLSFKLCRQLSDLFPGSSQARILRLDQEKDRALWDFAKANDYTLVSFWTPISQIWRRFSARRRG